MAKEIIATISVQTSINKDSDDRMNDRLLGETKRLKEQWIVVEGVVTIVGTVIIDTIKELLQLIEVNLLTQAIGTEEDIRVISIIVAIVVRVSKP